MKTFLQLLVIGSIAVAALPNSGAAEEHEFTPKTWVVNGNELAFIRATDGVWRQYTFEDGEQKGLATFKQLAENKASVLLYDQPRSMLIILTKSEAYLSSPGATEGKPVLQWKGSWKGPDWRP